MANVVHLPIDLYSSPASRSPKSLTFGFGLASPSSPWSHTNPSFQQLAPSINQNSPARLHKRRHELEDDETTGRLVHARDQSMDRSPTPERAKRAAPKRARVQPSSAGGAPKDDANKDIKQAKDDGEEVDVGVLLGKWRLMRSLLTFRTHLFKCSEFAASVPFAAVDLLAQGSTLLESDPYTLNTTANA